MAEAEISTFEPKDVIILDRTTCKLIYKGGFLNGKLHGRGDQYRSNGEIAYSGEWRDGEKHGQGTYFDSGGVNDDEQFEKNKIKVKKELTFSAQNCHSLNLSDRNQVKLKKKLKLITDVGTNVIFLSEVWMNTVKNPQNANTVGDIVSGAGYQLVYNSTQACRGVAILIKEGIGLRVRRVIRDDGENMLLLVVESHGIACLIGAVYGPNKEDKDFYTNLRDELEEHRDKVIILGGDWNTLTLGENITQVYVNIPTTLGNSITPAPGLISSSSLRIC